MEINLCLSDVKGKERLGKPQQTLRLSETKQEALYLVAQRMSTPNPDNRKLELLLRGAGDSMAPTLTKGTLIMEDTLSQLEEKISQAPLSDPQRKELLSLTQSLRKETLPLAETHRQSGENIVGLAHKATHEALQEQRDPHRQKQASDALQSSVQEFEKSHPVLVDTVDRICRILANLGI